MKPLVLDCSIALSWCFADEANTFSDQVLEYLRKHGAIAPSIWTLELTNGLLTAQKKKRITLDGVLAFLEMFARLPIRITNFTTKESFTKIFNLGFHHNLSTYDASYLYLAERENAPLATLDKALKAAARKCKLPKLLAHTT
jgi:predicted nucleic acid-binding protein